MDKDDIRGRTSYYFLFIDYFLSLSTLNTAETSCSPSPGRRVGSWLLSGVVGGGVWVGGEPAVEGDGEGEEFVRAGWVLLVSEGVDHLDVERGVGESGVVEALDVVEEVAGEGGVGFYDGALKAEVVVVLRNALVDGGALDGDGDEWDVDGLGALQGEEAAVDLVLGGGGEGVARGGDELEAGVVELQGAVAVVGEDDADGQETVLDVGQTEEGAELGVVAGVGGDGEVLPGVSVVGGVGGGGVGRRRGAVVGGAGGEAEEGCGYDGEQRSGAKCTEGSRGVRIARVAMQAHAGLIIIIAGAAVKLCGCGRERRDNGDGAV